MNKKYQLFYRYVRINHPETSRWIMTKKIDKKYMASIMSWTNTSHSMCFPFVYPAHGNMIIVKKLMALYPNGVNEYNG